MENVIKGVKVNGTSYGIDYDSLANRPVYKDITMGEYLIEETTLSFANYKGGGLIASIDIEEGIEDGDRFIVTVDGTEYECESMTQENSAGTLYAIGSTEVSLTWSSNSKSGGWYTGEFRIFITKTSDIAVEDGDHLVSVRHYSKDIKTLDREYFGLFNLAAAPITKIEKNLGLTDLVGSVLSREDYICLLVTGASRLDNGFVGVMNAGDPFTYNPVSGYILAMESEGNTFDTSEALAESDSYESSSFVGSALVYGDGDPVIIYFAYQNDSIWNLRAAEPYLRDADGTIVHDFSSEPIQLNISTGEWILTGDPTQETVK